MSIVVCSFYGICW